MGPLPIWALTFQWAEWMNWPEGGQSWECERSLWGSHLSHIAGKVALLTAGWGIPVLGKWVQLTVWPEIWPWGHSQSQLIRQTIWWSEEIPRKGVHVPMLWNVLFCGEGRLLCVLGLGMLERRYYPGTEGRRKTVRLGEKEDLAGWASEAFWEGLGGFRGSWPVPLAKQNRRDHVIQACKTEEGKGAFRRSLSLLALLKEELPWCHRQNRVNNL